MKKLFWLLLLNRFVLECQTSRSSLALAASQLVRDFLVAKSVRFDFIVYGQDLRRISDIVNDVLKLTNDNCTFKTRHASIKNPIIIDKSAIVFFDTFTSYLKFHGQAILKNLSPDQSHFLIYIEDWSDNDRELFFSQVVTTNHLLHFETFLI